MCKKWFGSLRTWASIYFCDMIIRMMNGDPLGLVSHANAWPGYIIFAWPFISYKIMTQLLVFMSNWAWVSGGFESRGQLCMNGWDCVAVITPARRVHLHRQTTVTHIFGGGFCEWSGGKSGCAAVWEKHRCWAHGSKVCQILSDIQFHRLFWVPRLGKDGFPTKSPLHSVL